MKRLLLIMALTALAVAIVAQEPLPRPKAVERAYRADYRQALKSEQAVIDRLEEEGWDFFIDLPERVPTAVLEMGADAIDHWAEGVLLPETVRARLLAECTQPVVLKISDSGVDTEHPELKGKWWLPGANYTGSTGPINLHGTHVAGISFSLLEPLILAGKVQLKDCRVLNEDGAGSFSWAANMLATERTQDKSFEAKGVHVVYNMSWGGRTGVQSVMEKEFQTSAAEGVIFIAAAGNNGPGEAPSYPASSQWAVATASLDQSLQVSSYSTRGTFVDNAMPGRSINSTVPGGGFATLSGTSMASPMLAAIAVVAKSKWGDRIPDVAAMHKYLAALASDVAPAGWDNASGWGLVYFLKVLDTAPEGVIGNPPPPPPPPPPATLKTIIVDVGGYFMDWRGPEAPQGATLFFPSIKMTYTGGKSAEALYTELLTWLPSYFNNRGLILGDNMSAPDAAFFTGRFLELIAADNGMKVDVTEVKAVDEQARSFLVTVAGVAPPGGKIEGATLTVKE